MSLLRSIDRYGIAPGLAACLLVGGCASGPNFDGGEAVGVDTAVERDVPSEVLASYEQAVVSMAAGDTIDAELRFREFLLRYPDYAGAHVNLAIIFADRGDLDAAENSLADALAVDPAHAAALNRLGMLERRRGRFAAAESAYLRAIAASPDYSLAHYNLGVLNDLYLGRLDAALTHYERYRTLVGEDEQVSRWITDLKRRIDRRQRTANVTE